MRIVVAMSGGVDSSVAAAMLVEQGHEVIGISMQLYDQSDGSASFGSCCSLNDLNDARRVAATLDIPHYVINLERQFADRVVANFVDEYTSGRTPLPCAHCNSDLKFATLADRARGFGAEAVATGHYARVERDGTSGRYFLRRGVDASKDQAYFLFSLTQEQLAWARFPIGDMPKAAVRQYARARGLPVADKPDSQEICFIPDDDYASFVAARAPDATAGGTIVDEGGRVLGRHDGIHRYTIGQRKGLGLSSSATGQAGPKASARTPLYVLALRPEDRQVVVGARAALERTSLTASQVNWIADRPDAGLRVTVQIRHRHRPASGLVEATGDGQATVTFDDPQTAVTPGQAVVFYEGDVVIGGGWIDSEPVARTVPLET
jgi:tRNA-uridine 2-sulfurtransferase